MNRSTSLYEQFVPVEITSPANKSRRGNLTGNERKIKDACADLYNYVQRWNGAVARGADVLKSITETKLKNSESGDMDEMLPDIMQESSQSELVKEISELCDQLENVVSELENVFEKIKKTTHMLKIIGDLAEMQSQHRSSLVQQSPGILCKDEPLFQGWPARSFYEKAKTICEQCEKELVSKKRILRSIAFLRHEKQLSFYTAAWLHQAYINEDEITVLLEWMLRATGHC